MNRIKRVFENRTDGILSMYFTAGFPGPEDTRPILDGLIHAGADLIEIGIPFSDPVADGPTIQASNQQALEQGMTLEKLFQQLKGFRSSQNQEVPVLLMGYINPILQFGVEAFCRECSEIGLDGVIVPDLPISEYESHYKSIFQNYGLANIFLITPQTSDARIRAIDALSDSFIYMVATAGTTGARQRIGPEQLAYFERVSAMGLKNPRLIGFGISDAETFRKACEFAQGAIIGSAFIKAISGSNSVGKDAAQFVKSIKSNVNT
jgi:tryptophan synthase alpha chain